MAHINYYAICLKSNFKVWFIYTHFHTAGILLRNSQLSTCPDSAGYKSHILCEF